MSYSPTLGCWLERDPIGEPNVAASANSEVMNDAIARAKDKALSRFGVQEADDWWLWRFTDGMNEYQFVAGNPENSTDPSGLDRYVTGPEPHQGIAVDTWALVGGKWVKTGIAQYDFAVDERYGPLTLGALVGGCPGRVTPSTFLGPVTKTISSSPQADIYLKSSLDWYLICPAMYHLIFFNCRTFVEINLHEGMPPQPAATPQEVEHARQFMIPLGY